MIKQFADPEEDEEDLEEEGTGFGNLGAGADEKDWDDLGHDDTDEDEDGEEDEDDWDDDTEW